MEEYKMRRSEREASLSAAEKILYGGEYGVLSTVGADGCPYGVPLNFAYDGKKIYFHCAANAGHKQENLRFSSRVSFCVVRNNAPDGPNFTEKYECAIVFGTAEKVEENKPYALELLVKKYSPELYEQGLAMIKKSAHKTDVYEISIEKINGKIHE